MNSLRNDKAGTTVFASLLSVSLSFTFLKLFLFIVRNPRFVPSPCFMLSPESAFYT